MTVLDPSVLPTQKVRSLYVHVPFCFHKCHYCDFYSITRQTDERMQAFVDRLLVEAETFDGAGPIETIFIGGGTPTLLPPAAMARLLQGLARHFDLTRLEEFTVEANPATADAAYFRLLRDHGVTRVSIGAQSFFEDELAALERHHDPRDVPQAVDAARQAGIDRVSIDLIFSIPGQTIDRWMANLERAMRLAVDHLSCYALTYEPNTALGVRKRLGRVQAVAEESEREMFDATARFLQGHDLHRYEVSNFARIGYESRHNLAYWRGENYLGLGPSAASHVDGTRWRNTPHLGRWESGVDNARLNVIDYESLDARARAAEMIWLGLRTREGVDVAATGERTGADVLRHHGETIRALSDGGLLVAGSGRIRLHPDAWHLADGVAAEFLVD